MSRDYHIVRTAANTETIVKKSRFVGYSFAVADLASLKKMLNNVRSQHSSASHVCYGVIIGDPDSGQQLFDDDGEPGGTAGRPILNVLQHADVGDSCLVVVRYFGGIKLGAGGLVRAYSGCAANTLKSTKLVTRIAMIQGWIRCDFALENQARLLLKSLAGSVQEPQYGQDLSLPFRIPEKNGETLKAQLQTMSKGKASVKFNPDL